MFSTSTHGSATLPVGGDAIGSSFAIGAANLAQELPAFKRKFPSVDTAALEGRMRQIGQHFGAYVPHYYLDGTK